MKLVELTFPAKRVVCFFCQKVLLKKNKFDDLCIETSAGVLILACSIHKDEAYKLIEGLNLWKAHHTNSLLESN